MIRWAQLGLELIVVVVGILMALAIDSWWAERQERILEASVLEQLAADLARADSQLVAQLSQTEAAAQAALDLVAAARGEREAPGDSIASWLTRVSWWSDPVPITSSAQALVSSNSLHVIRNDRLRSSVVAFLDQTRQFESRIPRHEVEISRRMDEIRDVVDPFARGQVVYVGVLEQGVEAHAASSAASGATIDLRTIVKDPRIQRSALELFWAHENLRWLQQRIIDATQGLRAEIPAASEEGEGS
jgi:uncharacterized protein (UPF0335 family)